MSRRTRRQSVSPPSASRPPPAVPVAGGAALRAWQYLAVLVGFAALAFAVYAPALHGPFVFDDVPTVVNDHYVRGDLDWHHGWREMVTQGRPVVVLSFILNRKLGGWDAWGFHVTNVLLHVAAASVLFLLLRLTLLSERCRASCGAAATPLALASAGLWLLHPLQTQAVAYIVQRAEVMVSLCLLLALYVVARAQRARRPGWWLAGLLPLFVVGFGCKQVMVAAPLLVVLYDGAFGPGGWRGAWQRGRYVYSGLALAALAMGGWFLQKMLSGPLVDLRLAAGRSDYFWSQAGVLCHYLRLAWWPSDLCLDYAWMVARGAAAIVPYALLLGLLIVASGVALWRWPAAGFAGLAFFVVLAPTSSFVPILDLCVEHRMYAALATLLTLAVVGGYHGGRWWWARQHGPGVPPAAWLGTAGWLLVVALGLAYGWRTHLRAGDYAADTLIWEKVTQVRPTNPRGYANYGLALLQAKRYTDAEPVLRMAIKTNPQSAEAHYNLGLTLEKMGRPAAEVEPEYRAALARRRAYPDCLNSLGALVAQAGNLTEGEQLFGEAVAADPWHYDGLANLATAELVQGKVAAASEHYTRAIALRPVNDVQAKNRAHDYFGLARCRLALHDLAGAQAAFAEAQRLKMAPDQLALFAAQLREYQAQPPAAPAVGTSPGAAPVRGPRP